jgi:hypothetical protein
MLMSFESFHNSYCYSLGKVNYFTNMFRTWSQAPSQGKAMVVQYQLWLYPVLVNGGRSPSDLYVITSNLHRINIPNSYCYSLVDN